MLRGGTLSILLEAQLSLLARIRNSFGFTTCFHLLVINIKRQKYVNVDQLSCSTKDDALFLFHKGCMMPDGTSA
jgi:hypothetical protein